MDYFAFQALDEIDPGPVDPKRPLLVMLPRELIIEIAKMLDADRDAKLSPLSLVNRALRDLTIPMLFRRMQLTTGEDELLEHLDNIQSNRAILDAVRILGIYSEGCSTVRTPLQNVILGYGENCKRGTAIVLADVLFDMPNLQDLRLDLRFKANLSLIGPLRRTFKQQFMQFHLITALNFPMKTDIKFIPDVFPNLQALSLELHNAPDLTPDLRHISQHVRLKYLELWKARWGPSDFLGIPTLFPNVSHLTIGGAMAIGNRPRAMQSLSNIGPTLARLANLRVLAISNESFCNRQTRNVKGAMDTVKLDVLTPGDKATAQGAAPTAKTYLVTLPRELIIEIIEACRDIRPPRDSGYSRRDRGIVVWLSCVNKCLRNLCIPFIFQNMELSTREDDLYDHLQAIAGNKHILEVARCLFLKTYGPESPQSPWSYLDPSPPIAPCGALAPALLVKVLGKMNLEELRVRFVGGNKSLARLFCGELAAQRVNLPSVQVLTYPHHMMVDLIPSVFSNLRILSLMIRGSPRKTLGLRAIAPELHRLDTLELQKGRWSLTGLEEVAELFPSIPRLLISGHLMATRVSKLIPVFKKMTNLKDLSLTEDPVVFPRLEIGDDGFLEELDLLRAQNPLKEDSEGNALEFFRQCPRLKKLLLSRDFEAKTYHPVKQGDSVVKVEMTTEDLDLGWPTISKTG
ncbi:F-box domain-containing protein [Colletotrichum cereale]|nr:F-box domain-containing protein [Colletotrichum cereale]